MAKYLMVLVIFWWPVILFAQDELPEPQSNTHQTPGPPPPGLVIPIDSGITILIVSGLLLGSYTVWRLLQKAD